MGPWDTVTETQENDAEEEIDMFAVLGAVQPTSVQVQSNFNAPMTTTSNDPLAAFMDDEEEETLSADSLFSMNDEPSASTNMSQEPSASVSNVSEPLPVASSQQTTPTLSNEVITCLLYTSPSPRDKRQSRMPSSA